MTHLSFVRSVAAKIGKAEFFDPLILTDPFKGCPPRMTILSIPCDQQPLDSLVILPD